MQSKVFTIFTGDTKTMSLKVIYAESGNPLDLTDCTAIDVALPKADGTFAHLTLAGGDVVITTPVLLGNLTALVQSAVSALLNVGEFQNVDVTFTIGGKPMTVRFFQALSVYQRD